MGTTCSTSPENLTSSISPKNLTSKHRFPEKISIGGIVFPVNRKRGTFKIFNKKCHWTTVTLVQKLPPKPSSTPDTILLEGGRYLVKVVTDCGNYTLSGDCSTTMIVYYDGRPSENLFIEEYNFGLILLVLQPENCEIDG